MKLTRRSSFAVAVAVVCHLAGPESYAQQPKDRVRLRHPGEVLSVAFSPAGKTLATGGQDQLVRLWDVASGKELTAFKAHADRVFSVTFSPDGKTLASGSIDGTVRLWEVLTGKERAALKGDCGPIYSVAFSPDGKTVAAAAYKHPLQLWEVATGKTRDMLRGHRSTVFAVSFSPDGKSLASGSFDETAKLWELATSKERSTLGGDSGKVISVAFSPDGKILAGGDEGKGVRLWDVTTSKERATFKRRDCKVWPVAFSPDGKTLASGWDDGSVILWDIAAGTERAILTGHTIEVTSLAFSPDGKILASGSRDRTARLWDVGSVLQPALPTVVVRGTRQTDTYRRIKKYLDAVPAIDTHDHLWPFDKLPGYVETDKGKGMNLYSIWRNSYYTWNHPLTPWKDGQKFDDWWAKGKHDFDNARSASFYRYQLPAFQDLYGVDFEKITDEQARELNDRIFRNYLDQRWLYEVVTEKANIELMFNDPYWARFDFKTDYKFGVIVLNVTTLVRGFHPSEFKSEWDDPYVFAKKHELPLKSLDDYLVVLDRLFSEAKSKGAVCLKTTLAYQRTLRFENVPKDRAAKVFGRPKSELTDKEVKEFEDFIMWRLVELSAKHGLPFQIHTGDARIQGSNPMNLVDLIEANPKTKFILFHGGYPWVGETGVIVMRHGAHVWIDSCWLPTISYTMAKRAYHEWLDVMPSTKIMWGADCNHGEGIYGATEFTRRCLAEVLAEKVDRGDLLEEHAQRIGKQILRDNALELFPQLKDRLWKRTGKLIPPVR